MRIVLLATVLLASVVDGVITGQAAGKHVAERDLPRYDLRVRVLPDAHRLEADGTVRVPAASVPRDSVVLVLSQQMHDFQVEILEPAEMAGPVTMSSAPMGRDTHWTIQLRQPLPGGESALLRFSYAGGKEIDRLFYVGPEISFATAYGTDWYPLVDSRNDQGTGSIRLSIPPGMVALAEGDRRSTPDEEATGDFRFESVHPTYFSFAVGPFHVVRTGGRVPIALYLLKERGDMRPFASGVAKIVHTLAQEFGPYPFKELALVEVPRDLAQRAGFNAATVQGFIYVNHAAFGVPDVAMLYEWLGHEISHSWFPNSVALRTPPGLYMEEALAEYGGMRAVEVLAGSAAAEEFRRTGYAPDPVYSAAAYFKLVGRGVDHELDRLAPSAEDRDLAYTKGALVWDMLSREVGRKSFRQALARITRRRAFSRLTWPQLLREIEAATGRKLGWFYQQWFGRTGAPEFQLRWVQTGSVVRCTIVQPPPYYRVTLTITASSSSGRLVTRRVGARGRSTSFVFGAGFAVQTVELDPHYEVMRWTPFYRDLAREAAAPK